MAVRMQSDPKDSSGTTTEESFSSTLQRRHAWLIEGAAVVLTLALRLWVTRGRTVYLATPDEASHLAIARTLSGSRPFHMLGLSFDAGYGTFLAPIYWMVEHPELAFRLALLANVVIAGLTLVVLRALVIRVLGLTGKVAIWCAAIALAFPGAAMQTMFSGSEGLIAMVIPVVLLLALRLQDARRPLFAVLSLALVTSLSVLVHSRLFGVALAVAVILVASGVRKEIPRAVAAVGVVALFLSILGVRVYNGAVQDVIWVAGSPGSADRVEGLLSRIDPDAMLSILASGGGMIWHQLVTTFGLVIVGVVYLLVSALQIRGTHGDGAEQFARWKIILILVAAAGPAVVWMSDRPLAGHMVYGRYWDPLVVPIVAVAVGWLVWLGRRRATQVVAGSVLVMGAFSLLFYLARQDAITAAFEARGFRSPRRIIGLLAYVEVGDFLTVAGITLKALAVMAVGLAVFILVHRSRRLVIILVFLTFACIGTVRASLHMDDAGGLHAARWRPAMALVDDGVLPEDAVVAFQLDQSMYEVIGPKHPFAAYQFYQPHVDFVGIKGEGVFDYPWVVSDLADPMLNEEGWEVVFEHPDGRGLAIWEHPDRSQEAD